jgi:hypothetical protein
MALRSTIAAVAAAAFNAVGDIKTDVVYIRRTSAYSTSTGKVSNTDVSVPLSGIIIPPGPIRKNIMADRPETPVNEIETRLMVKTADMNGVVPKIKDLVTIDGVNWTIEDISWDPANVTYTFKIKKP